MTKNNAAHFNTWAKAYNQSVQTSDQEQSYPFAGYAFIKAWIMDTLNDESFQTICDMGVGTGEISAPLYALGKSVIGVDFSKNMLEKAKTLMPKARFVHNDFESFVNTHSNETFDAVIFNYSIHHLPLKTQTKLILELFDHLSDGGIIIIGDVMSKDDKEMEKLKKQYTDIWDHEEHYPLVDRYKRALESNYHVTFYRVSHCSGIMQFTKRAP